MVIGDPQAPLATFFEVLDRHGLLGSDGRLAGDVQLTSIGDHFDWGPPAAREAAATDGLRLVCWLAAHERDQVTLLLGNHDLARVGELAIFDDDTFARAQAEADAAYHQRSATRTEEEFRRRHHQPSWEVIARDFSAFRVAQRTCVEGLLRARRFKVAYAAAADLLLSHAGVTLDELDLLGIPLAHRAEAPVIEAALDDALDRAIDAWRAGAFGIAGLHAPGDASGEGRGMFYHRPALRSAATSDEPGVERW